jgi:multiple sugar transport system substrate-binding protein
MKRAPLTIAAAALSMASGLAPAANQPGSFPGVVIDAKIIGGDQYEPLYILSANGRN